VRGKGTGSESAVRSQTKENRTLRCVSNEKGGSSLITSEWGSASKEKKKERTGLFKQRVITLDDVEPGTLTRKKVHVNEVWMGESDSSKGGTRTFSSARIKVSFGRPSG